MRFGRRGRDPLLRGRRSKDKTSKTDFQPVEADEREALLSSKGQDVEGADSPAGDEEREESAMSPDKHAGYGDPTQRLLTALGRFHRQVAKAQGGAAQEHWCDECMNQLIAALKIALEQESKELAGALTDTARILQSCEDAGAARLAVPFLADSYEMLCLMVGDLIVGKVRPGVLQKWMQRYQAAVDDLAAANIPLVQDEQEERAPRIRAAVEEPVAAAAGKPFSFVGPSTESDTRSAAEAGPATDESATAAQMETVGVEPLDEPLRELQRVEEAATQEIAGYPEDAAAIPQLEEMISGGRQPLQAGVYEQEETPETPSMEPAGERGAPERETAAALDRLCEGLAHMEKRAEDGLEATFAAMESDLSFLQDKAEADGRTVGAELCRIMTRLCRPVWDNRAAPSDKFYELAYAFCGLYAEADDAPGSADVRNWISECEGLAEAWSAEPLAPAPEEAATETPRASAQTEERSAVELLGTAQQAFARGAAVDAKLLALEAAASIARSQANEAEARVQQAEQRLREGATAIEQAHARLQQLEREVLEAEAQTKETSELLHVAEAEVEAKSQAVAEVERRIEAVTQQIRALEAQRDGELQRKTELDAERGRAQDFAAQTQAHLDNLKKAEEDARVRLEDGRQQVKHLQRKRNEIESAMERMRDLLAHRRAWCADIEQTILGIRNAEVGKETLDDDLLF